VGRRIVVLESTGSTNDDARRLAAEGAPEGTVVIAHRQTAGRGRLGRPWDSPAHLGLYLSIVLRPPDPPERLGRYAVAAAVAVCEAARALVGPSVTVKWPNDVLAGGRKLSGILAELRSGPSGAELVVGVGINVNQLPADFPQGLAATSLRILAGGAPLAREGVAFALLRALDEATCLLRSDDWTEIATRFLRYAPDAAGRRVRLASGGTGVTSGLDATGALAVTTASGVVLAHAGESVTLIEE